jgi:hypothetical protein
MGRAYDDDCTLIDSWSMCSWWQSHCRGPQVDISNSGCVWERFWWSCHAFRHSAKESGSEQCCWAYYRSQQRAYLSKIHLLLTPPPRNCTTANAGSDTKCHSSFNNIKIINFRALSHFSKCTPLIHYMNNIFQNLFLSNHKITANECSALRKGLLLWQVVLQATKFGIGNLAWPTYDLLFLCGVSWNWQSVCAHRHKWNVSFIIATFADLLGAQFP